MTEPLGDERERLLISRAQTGDQEAFNALASHYRPLLVEFAQQATGDRDDAEDAVQNGLIYAWSHLSEFHYRPHKFKFWLQATVKNCSKRVHDASNYKRVTHLRDDDFATVESRAVDDLDNKELVKPLELAIESLPRAQREVFDLTLDGYTPKQISSRLGITIYATKKNLASARRQLKVSIKVSDSDTFGDYI